MTAVPQSLASPWMRGREWWVLAKRDPAAVPHLLLTAL